MTALQMDATEQRVVCRLATEPWELLAYHALRRRIFCDEQKVFEHDDQDEWDALAVPIVSVWIDREQNETIIGVVRIYEESPGVWYGGRLGVDMAYRSVGNVGRLLIVKAVSTAHAWGCRQFLAIVQPQNVPLFRRLRWRAVQEVSAHGRPHSMMVADLAYYPPSTDHDVTMRPKAPCHDAA